MRPKTPAVAARHDHIASVLEDGPMTVTALWEALQGTQFEVAHKTMGNDLRRMHDEQPRRVYRRERHQFLQREVLWTLPPQMAQEPSNLGRTMVLRLVDVPHAPRREKADRCCHGMRSGQCWACGR